MTDYRVTYADGATQPQGDSLTDIREALEDAGYEQQELILPTRTHNGGRYNPTWREVWVREIEEYVPLHALSPEARKAQLQAEGKMRECRPWLKRTSEKAIVQRPTLGDRRHQRVFTSWMKVNLPGFRFNSKRNWWEADLTDLPTAYETLKTDGVNVSNGVRACLGDQ